MIDRDTLEDEPESPRQIARRQRRQAGDRSAYVARALIFLSDYGFKSLALDEELRAAILRARTTVSHGAKRREERRLAGILRSVDLANIEEQLESLKLKNQPDVNLFHKSEAWREKFIENGELCLTDFAPQLSPEQKAHFLGLIVAAQKERQCGKPRGAGRALFREIIAYLKLPDVNLPK